MSGNSSGSRNSNSNGSGSRNSNSNGSGSRNRNRNSNGSSGQRVGGRFILLDRAHEAAVAVDRVVGRLPRSRNYLRDQARRSISSVCLNLAEGNAKRDKDRARFFRIALGSCYETSTAMRLVHSFGLAPSKDVRLAQGKLDEVQRMTWTIIKRLQA